MRTASKALAEINQNPALGFKIQLPPRMGFVVTVSVHPLRFEYLLLQICINPFEV